MARATPMESKGMMHDGYRPHVQEFNKSAGMKYIKIMGFLNI